MSLGLNLNQPIGAFVPEPRHKSAGRAFALSLLLPGLGQFYCGKIGRGGMTLAFWLLGLIFCIARPSTAVVGEALVVMLVLWIFSFLDAYFTAIEINEGQDDLVDEQNPRVAVTLNLLTAGFGYFYLGEQVKGLFLFVAIQVARFALPTRGFWGISIGLVLVGVQLVVALDAYQIARRKVKEALGADPVVAAAASAAPASRLPVQVPVVLACILPVGFVVLVVIGLAVSSIRSGRRTAAAALNNRLTVEPTPRSDAQRERKMMSHPRGRFRHSGARRTTCGAEDRRQKRGGRKSQARHSHAEYDSECKEDGRVRCDGGALLQSRGGALDQQRA